jgi:hypothetical protein
MTRHRKSDFKVIFDFKVVRITRSGMHLVGYEIKVEEDGAVEYVQGWWAKSLDAQTDQEALIEALIVLDMLLINDYIIKYDRRSKEARWQRKRPRS